MTNITGPAPTPVNLHFSKDMQDRKNYADGLKAQLDTVRGKSLKEVTALYNQVIEDVGQTRLHKAEVTCKSNPVRYFLWSKEHPRLDIFFRIITCGIMHAVARRGEARYQQKGPILEIAKSVGIIQSTRSEKIRDMERVSSKLNEQLQSYETFSPSKALELLNEQTKINGEQDARSSHHVRVFLNTYLNRFLNASKTFIDDTYYNDLIALCQQTAPNSRTLMDLQQTKAIYTEAQEWPTLAFDTKLTLLATMQEDPTRYKSILQQIIAETEKNLTWDQFSTKSIQERQEIITQINIILDIPNLQEAAVLSAALENLREYIRTAYFKECAWNNQEIVQHIEGVCQNLDIIDECAIAKQTAFLEANWNESSFDERIQNTLLLVHETEKYYEKELDRRRKEVFGKLEGLLDRPVEEFNYVIGMLDALEQVYKKGCAEALEHVEEQLLARMDQVAKSGEPRDDLIAKAEIYGIEDKVLKEFIPQGWISSAFHYIRTGKSQSERIDETVSLALLEQRQRLRALGVATPISRVPTPKDIAKLQIDASHLKVSPPSIRQIAYKSKITELNDFLREADKAGFIPSTFTESASNTSSLQFNKNDLLYRLSTLFSTLEHYSLNDRLTKVRDVLGPYTDQVKERLKSAQSQSEKRDIYTELVELVCKEMGYACYHCEDRKVNAAMMIYNEKLATEVADSGTPQQKVFEWLAQKRDALVSNILQEMVQHNINTSRLPVFYDVSSSISRWRYVLRRPLGLGDVPSPAHSIDSGLTEAQIINRFNKTYTRKWILEQAMEEHAKENGNKALKINTINDYLESRISNFDEIKYDMLDEETYKLVKGGMALYLQEIGVFHPLL